MAIAPLAARAQQKAIPMVGYLGLTSPGPFAPLLAAFREGLRQWTGALKGHAFFAYAANYLIDLDHAIIVDVEASRAIRQAEVGAARTMINRAEDHFGLYPERLAADTAYGTAEMLNWLVHEQGIEPHIPVFDKSQRTDGTFSRGDFAYEHKRDCYICPAGRDSGSGKRSIGCRARSWIGTA